MKQTFYYIYMDKDLFNLFVARLHNFAHMTKKDIFGVYYAKTSASKTGIQLISGKF